MRYNIKIKEQKRDTRQFYLKNIRRLEGSQEYKLDND